MLNVLVTTASLQGRKKTKAVFCVMWKMATRASTVAARVPCNVRCCVCRAGRHCRDKYDQNHERTKVAEGVLFFYLFFFFLAQVGEGEGDWRDFILVWGRGRGGSLSDPKACCVIVLPVILDLNPCLYL